MILMFGDVAVSTCANPCQKSSMAPPKTKPPTKAVLKAELVERIASLREGLDRRCGESLFKFGRRLQIEGKALVERLLTAKVVPDDKQRAELAWLFEDHASTQLLSKLGYFEQLKGPTASATTRQSAKVVRDDTARTGGAQTDGSPTASPADSESLTTTSTDGQILEAQVEEVGVVAATEAVPKDRWPSEVRFGRPSELPKGPVGHGTLVWTGTQAVWQYTVPAIPEFTSRLCKPSVAAIIDLNQEVEETLGASGPRQPPL